jgi:hypothetical protein
MQPAESAGRAVREFVTVRRATPAILVDAEGLEWGSRSQVCVAVRTERQEPVQHMVWTMLDRVQNDVIVQRFFLDVAE